MTMVSKPSLVLGYDLDKWNNYCIKEPITIDISPSTNSHTLLCGMSGAGKSYLEHQLLYRLILAEQNQEQDQEQNQEQSGEPYLADYKGDDTFSYLIGCSRYCSYQGTLAALESVHARLQARQSGEDATRHPITLVWDEYIAQVLALLSEDKKVASAVMGKVGEILLLGRFLSVRLIVSCQRADAIAFPAGSRLNYGVICVVGAAVRSIYEMLLPDHMEQIKGRQFSRGERSLAPRLRIAIHQGSYCAKRGTHEASMP